MTPPKTDREKLAPFLDIIAAKVSTAPMEDPCVVAAMILRESGATWAPTYEPQGDPHGFGDWETRLDGTRVAHGHGILQFDDRGPFKRFIDSGEAYDPERAIEICVQALKRARGQIRHHALPRYIGTEAFERTVIVSWNRGPARACMALNQFGDPDVISAHKNYGRWVIDKAKDLRATLPPLFATAAG